MILLEGGVAGHMSHLFENPSLKFSQIKDVFIKAASGELQGTEKTDGQNLFISYSIKEGKAKAARNKGNIKQGGLDAVELAKKFSGRGGLTEAFTDSFRTFEKAAQSLSIDEQLSIFGPDANVYYNAEIQDPRSPNVINYDTKTLTIHQVGHAEFDKASGQIVDRDIGKNFQALQNALSKMQNAVADEEYGIQINAIRNLDALSDDRILNIFLSRLENEINEVGLNDNNNIAAYILVRLDKLLEEEGLIGELKKMTIKRLMRVDGISANQVYKAATNPEEKELAKRVIKNEGHYVKTAIYPIEDIIHDFSVEMLKNLRSAFIIDQDKENTRLRKELENAIKVIEKSSNDEAIEILKKQMTKIKNIENVSTAAEGFVFDYDGKTYKFTGNFAPMNQILGLFRYGRGNIPPLQKITEDGTDNKYDIAIYPGKFKPPHAGHLNVAVEALNRANKVYVFISPREHEGITAEQSKRVWELYASRLGVKGQIVPVIADVSPVASTYYFIDEKALPGQSLLLVLGDKDLKDGRFNKAIDRREDVRISIFPSPPQAGGISATQMRSFLNNGDFPDFAENLPGFLDIKDKKKVWNLLLVDGLMNEAKYEGNLGAEEVMKFMMNAPDDLINQFDALLNSGDEQGAWRVVLDFLGTELEGIDEMSAMGAGAVAGFSGKKKKDAGERLINEEGEDNMEIKREEFLQELKLRQLIRKAIRLRENKFVSEETRLRSVIGKLVKEAIQNHPHESTGINVLEDLLKKIVPIIEIDYKALTTDPNQRKSFRSHIINAAQNALAPKQIEAEPPAAMDGTTETLPNAEMNEQDSDLNISTKPQDDRFIDIDNDGIPDSQEEEDTFSIPGEDETGRNFAAKCFDKIETNITDAYDTLANERDKSTFYDYLITNLKLYFDKFEDELRTEVPEPESSIYQKEKDQLSTSSEKDLDQPELDLEV